MIRYALRCDQEHEFESWFPSAASFDEQAARGLVACPVCGSGEIRKQIMAPRIGKKGGQEPVPAAAALSAAAAGSTAPGLPGPGLPAPGSADAPAPPVALLSEREQAVRAMLRAVREHVVRHADDVGRAFPEEARRMHYGEIEHRSIYGEADPAEARALADEGIEVHALPVVPDDRH